MWYSIIVIRKCMLTLQFCNSSAQARSNAPLNKNNQCITKIIFSCQKMRKFQLIEMFSLWVFALVINADTGEGGDRYRFQWQAATAV